MVTNNLVEFGKWSLWEIWTELAYLSLFEKFEWKIHKNIKMFFCPVYWLRGGRKGLDSQVLSVHKRENKKQRFRVRQIPRSKTKQSGPGRVASSSYMCLRYFCCFYPSGASEEEHYHLLLLSSDRKNLKGWCFLVSALRSTLLIVGVNSVWILRIHLPFSSI